jgi:serine/threonine-protein kinase
VDADIERLVREERLLEAAALASERGDARTASTLYERACEWTRASREALRAGDARRALELAVEAADDTLFEGALAQLAGDARALEAGAERLSRRGRDAWAARVLETAGDARAAARAWERAGEGRRAAELLERSGEPAGAARVLEATLRRFPESWGAAVALGALLVRFGKAEAAVRILQRVPEEAPERRDALAHLARALERIGLPQAAAEASAELAAMGGAPASEGPAQLQGAQRTRLFGRYDVVREVASSPSARVLEAIDVVRGERVAVKVLAAWDAQGSGRDALVRFEREVRTMRALDHASVVPMRDYLPEGPALVLEWMAGGTLERLLAATGALAPARAVEIASAVLSALGEAHTLGILHRDVKPANVLFDAAGGARLSDFGVAHLGDVSTTATGGVFGTLAYMSPEQREGRPATAKSDVFSVGVMLREALTGEKPGVGTAPRTIPSQAHRELDARHDALVARLTAVDPSERPGALEARSMLAALSWPADLDAGGARVRVERKSSAWPTAGRLEMNATDASVRDGWLGRAIERVPLDERTLARARAFAAAGHPALQTVLRVDRDDGTIWLEALPARSREFPLSPSERSVLAQALDALHAAGGVHGAVDLAHVVVVDDGVVLRFASSQDPTATVDRDRLALARL